MAPNISVSSSRNVIIVTSHGVSIPDLVFEKIDCLFIRDSRYFMQMSFAFVGLLFTIYDDASLMSRHGLTCNLTPPLASPGLPT